MSLSDVEILQPGDTVTLPAAAVAVSYNGRIDLSHAGIFYRSGSDVLFCDLGLNGVVTSQTIPRYKHVWTIPPLDPLLLEQLADLCHLVGGKTVPYGFLYIDATFSTNDGSLTVGDGFLGMSCATFVVAMFASINVHPIDVASWHNRPEDEEKQWKIAGYMVHTQQFYALPPATQEIISAIPCLRFRPEEVLSALRHPAKQHPVHVDTLKPLGAQLIAMF